MSDYAQHGNNTNVAYHEPLSQPWKRGKNRKSRAQDKARLARNRRRAEPRIVSEQLADELCFECLRPSCAGCPPMPYCCDCATLAECDEKCGPVGWWDDTDVFATGAAE